MPLTIVKRDVSSAKSSTIDLNFLGKSFYSVDYKRQFVPSIKILQAISGHKSYFTLNISVAKAWMFLWCIETDASFSKSFLQDDCLSL